MSKKRIMISLNGQEGAGKSTVAAKIAERLSIPRFYMGQMFRDMAAEKKITLPEFRKICDQDPSFDNQVDDYVKNLPKKQSDFIIESRTAWHFIPQSIKIYLKVDPQIAARRIFLGLKNNNNRGNEDKNLNTLENIQRSILQRRKEDNERYFSIYAIHQDKESNYDLVLDTTHLAISEVVEKILNFIDEKLS